MEYITPIVIILCEHEGVRFHLCSASNGRYYAITPDESQFKFCLDEETALECIITAKQAIDLYLEDVAA